MPAVDYPHIALNSSNVPILAGTTMKVVELVLSHLAHGWDAEDLHREFPYLSMGQIHCALGYYCDHREEIDQDIEDRRRMAEELRQQLEDPMLVERLRKLKRERSQS
jgi:uncharacterized protein (DUF433 family)